MKFTAPKAGLHVYEHHTLLNIKCNWVTYEARDEGNSGRQN